eukprot:SAG25_NODE_193_length_12184_cov_5.527844_3_plen_129_part_00
MARLDRGTKLEIMKHLTPGGAIKMGGINKEFRNLSTVHQHNLNPSLSKIQRAYRGHLKKVPELQQTIGDLASSRQTWGGLGQGAGIADAMADMTRRDLIDDRTTPRDAGFFHFRDRLRRPIDFGFTGW